MLAGLLLSLAGCVIPRPSLQATNAHFGPSSTQSESAARREVDQARDLIEDEEYPVAVPRLYQLIAKFPGTRAGREAYYWLGQAHEGMGSGAAAYDAYREYLRLAPGGAFAAEATQRAGRIQAAMREKYVEPEELDRQIAELREQAAANPDDLAVLWKLADLLWHRGRYAESGNMYVRIIEARPDAAGHDTVRSRLERLPNGQYVLLTPEELQRREVEAAPVVVINESTFRAGRDLFTRQATRYVVTGQVLNRGPAPARGVRVDVTLYGFGGNVLDTQTAWFGTLPSGATRAFSLEFRNFESIENVSRHESVVTYAE